MLKRARSKAAIRAALVVAAALSLTTSAGLHPEPSCGAPPARGEHASATNPTGRMDAAAHVCLVCLLHAAAIEPVVASAPPAGAPSGPNREWSRSAPVFSTEFRTNDGRAPPVLL